MTAFNFTATPETEISVDEDGMVVIPEPERKYSSQEKALRDNFVREYLSDYDEFKAAMRVGYSHAFAKEYGRKLLNEPYVQREIKRMEGTTEGEPKEGDEEDFKKRIIAALVRESNYRGPGSSQAARVAALSKLAHLKGMEPVKQSSIDLTTGGHAMEGAFVVPGVMTPEQWEAAAMKQQDDLTAPETPTNPAPSVH